MVNEVTNETKIRSVRAEDTPRGDSPLLVAFLTLSIGAWAARLRRILAGGKQNASMRRSILTLIRTVSSYSVYQITALLYERGAISTEWYASFLATIFNLDFSPEGVLSKNGAAFELVWDCLYINLFLVCVPWLIGSSVTYMQDLASVILFLAGIQVINVGRLGMCFYSYSQSQTELTWFVCHDIPGTIIPYVLVYYAMSRTCEPVALRVVEVILVIAAFLELCIKVYNLR